MQKRIKRMYNENWAEYQSILEGKVKSIATDKYALEIQVEELLDTLKKINNLNSLGKTKEIADTINLKLK